MVDSNVSEEKIVIEALKAKANGVSYSKTAKEYGITSCKLSKLKSKYADDICSLCEKHGVDIGSITGGWVKGEHMSLRFKESEKVQIDEYIEIINNSFDEKLVVNKNLNNNSGHLGILSMSDLHIGKPDTDIDKYFSSAVSIINSFYNNGVVKVLFITGNDSLNVDNVQLTTTKGTTQEMEVSLHEAISQLTVLYSNIIEYIQSKGMDCISVYSPANHDNIISYCVSRGVMSKYDIKSIMSDESRAYVTFGNTMIGITHGDKIKDSEYPSLMAVEEPKLWGETKFRYVFRGHKHHKERKDFRGCTVIGLRSLSSPDKWHRDSGYVGVHRSTEGFIVSKTDGIIAEYIKTI